MSGKPITTDRPRQSVLRPSVIAWAVLASIVASFVAVVFAADGAASLAGRVGGDFPAFYAAGSVVKDGDLDNLYDVARQRDAQSAFHDDDAVLYFAYPPPVAVAYAGLAAFDYVTAYVLHTLLMAAAALAALVLVRPLVPTMPSTHIVAAIGITFLPMFMAVTLGQNTALLLLLVVASWRLAVADRDELAGLVLGVMLFKPQYAVALIGLHLVRGRWRIVASAAAAAGVWWLAGTALLGADWLGEWIAQVSDFTALDAEVNGANAVSWLGIAEHLLGVGEPIALAIGGGLAALTALVLVACWWGRRSDDLAAPMALAGVGIVLTSPHAMFYDAGLAAVTVAALAGTGRVGLGRLVAAGWIIGALHPVKDVVITPVGLVVVGAFAVAVHRWLTAPPIARTTPSVTTGHQPGAAVDLSVIIPAFDEAGRIDPTLASLASWLDQRAATAEVIVVDDGSADDTTQRSLAFSDQLPNLQVITLAENRGKGHAVRIGMLAATGTWRAFLDADGSTDPSELPKLLAPGAAVTIASVAVDGAVLDRAQSGLRSSFGRFGNGVIQRLVLPGIEDSQRGCKVFRGDVADDIFAVCTIDGWGFDVEVLALARARGHEPVEIGVRWEHRPVGHVRPWHYLTTIVEVIRIRLRVGHQPRVDTSTPAERL